MFVQFSKKKCYKSSKCHLMTVVFSSNINRTSCFGETSQSLALTKEKYIKYIHTVNLKINGTEYDGIGCLYERWNFEVK